MQSAAGLVGERFRHEGRDHAALGRDHRQQVAQRDNAVGGGQRVGVLEVLLELTVAVLVVVGVVGPAESVHRGGDRGEVVVHPGDAAGVVTRLVGGVGGVGGRQAAVGVAVQQEVLDLGADPRLEPGVGGTLDQRLEDDPRCVRPRLAVDVRVAVHDRQPVLDERDRGERRRIGDRHQVGVFGLLADRADGVPGEADALGGQQLDGLDRDQLGARLPAQVDEQREDELRPGLVGHCGEVGGHVWALSLDMNQSITIGNTMPTKPAGAGEWVAAPAGASGQAGASSYDASRWNAASMPFSSSSGEMRMPIVFLIAKAMSARDDERVDHHRACRDRLPPQLVETAAVEQSVGGVGHAFAGEEADQQSADDAADQVDADHVEGVVVAEALLEPDRVDTDGARDRAEDDRSDRRDRTAGGCDRDQAGDGSRGRADAGDVAVLDLLDRDPGQRGGTGGDERGDHDDGGGVARGQSRSAVEGVPAGPQQARTEQGQRHVVRLAQLAPAADLPSTIATASAAAPALMCTAVPPAKSMAFRLLAIQPPTESSVTTPSKAKTQCATGKYTRTAQTAAKTIHAPNFIRSATAPEIRATVIAANNAWNKANSVIGNPLIVVFDSSRSCHPGEFGKTSPTNPP